MHTPFGRRRHGQLLAPAILALATLATANAMAAPAQLAQSRVERGHYVATVAGCSACHTADDGQPYAGGRVLHTPFGELAVPNITPDPDTGIGDWTQADFVRALHEGFGDGGQPLYPAMPYSNYTKMTDDDVAALWAYMKTLEPVRHDVQVNRLPFPFDVRESLYAWRALYFQDGRFQPDPGHDDEWNRGAYLVQAQAHCGACHTPRNALGGQIADQTFKGAEIENWYAPDISTDAGSAISNWSVDRLFRFLSGEHPDNQLSVGSMRAVVHDMAQMRPEDVRAIAVYLKTRTGDGGDAGSQAGAAAAPAHRAKTGNLRGAEIYNVRCQSCHTDNGKGVPGIGASLVGSNAVVSAKPDNVISVLLRGVGPRGVYGAMPSFRRTLDNRQIAEVTNYIRQSWGNDAPANADPQAAARIRAATETIKAASRASECPDVPANEIDARTLESVRDLATADKLKPDRVASLVQHYRGAFPDLGEARWTLNLSGLYCQRLAEQGGLDQAQVMNQEITFMEALLDSGK